MSAIQSIAGPIPSEGPPCPKGPLYSSREFHQSTLWRILVDHSEHFLRTYESRFGESHGPLPPQAEKVIDKLVRCGDPNYGLTLLHCADCNIHLAVPFSCKTRICPSCINRRAECLSHSLSEKLPVGDYRHLVVTLPKKMGLRKRFQLDTRLHRQIGRLVHRVIGRWMSTQIGCHRNRREEKERARPGIIMVVQSFGAGLKSHVHFHILVSDGPEGVLALGLRQEPRVGLLSRRQLLCLGVLGRARPASSTAPLDPEVSSSPKMPPV